MEDLTALRQRVRSELAELLADYEPPAATLLGAGSDDVEAPRQFLQRVGAAGYLTPSWPAEYGGLGFGREESRLVQAELARLQRPDLYHFNVGLLLVGPTLLKHGSADQLGRWLPRIVSGADIWCQLFSEPDAGSDLAALKTKAERDGDGWRVTGSKVWSSRAHYSDLGFALARFDSSLPKHEGVLALVIDMRAPGVEVRPLRQINGDTHFSEVFLDGVRVDDCDRVGEVGEGWSVARTMLGFERQAFGGENSGSGSGLRQRLLDLAGAAAVRNDPARRDRLMKVWCDLQVASLTVKRSAALASARKPDPAAAAGTKLRMAANLKQVASLALEFQGADGMLAEGSWHELFITAPSMSIRGGTDEVQRNHVGEQVLGLQHEPRVDRGPFSQTGKS